MQKLVSWGSVSGAREGQEPLQDLGAPSAKESACSAGGQGPPGSSIHGIFQARVLEWGAIAFSDLSLEVAFLQSHQSA